MSLRNEHQQSARSYTDSEEEQRSEQPVTVSSAKEAVVAALESSGAVSRHFPWIGPLVEAAVLCDPAERRPVKVYTQWSGGSSPVGDAEDADEEKHNAYSEHMLRTIQGVYPWLLPLLNASRAMLLVSPRICCFTVHTRLGVLFDIPQLIPLTQLTPFPPEKAELIH